MIYMECPTLKTLFSRIQNNNIIIINNYCCQLKQYAMQSKLLSLWAW